ncbi:hypothetical protein M378DRAFT_33779, partial [Amanita muscaria Koide BX008]
DTASDTGSEWSDLAEDELRGEALRESLRMQVEKDIETSESCQSTSPTPYEQLTFSRTPMDWKKAESSRSLGYNQLSKRTKERRDHEARLKEKQDLQLQKTIKMLMTIGSKGAALMRNYFKPEVQKSTPMDAVIPQTASEMNAPENISIATSSALGNQGMFTGYFSDLFEDEPGWDEVENDGDDETEQEVTRNPFSQSIIPSNKHKSAPPLKRRKLGVPVRESRRLVREKRQKELEEGLEDINKLIKSKRDIFDAGTAGLQSYRARAIQGFLKMVVHNGRKAFDASECAAESQGFAAKWGGRMVRSWVQRWLKDRELPMSLKGNHAKTFSLLDDPAIRAELRSYVRSNKWCMDPKRLAEFSKDNMVTPTAEKYLRNIIQSEMPRGLKIYMDVELFPRVHLKVGRGVSLRTTRRWLSNDGKGKSWVLEGEHPLKKKGVGRGIHQSDVICSTVGWLREASQTLEYGKNYDGYWNGELFLVEKIIPAFERAHGPGYQALFMVDNSQGHSAYAVDALLTQRMNLRPGGKQARLRNGWYKRNGEKINQSMIFPPDHPTFPNEPKGMKQTLTEHHCDYTFKTLQHNMPIALASVGLHTIRMWEH